MLGRRWETGSPSIAVDRNSTSLPTPTVEVGRICRAFEFFDLRGGATGVGVAIDAASCGYDVVLLEQSGFGIVTGFTEKSSGSA